MLTWHNHVLRTWSIHCRAVCRATPLPIEHAQKEKSYGSSSSPGPLVFFRRPRDQKKRRIWEREWLLVYIEWYRPQVSLLSHEVKAVYGPNWPTLPELIPVSIEWSRLRVLLLPLDGMLVHRRLPPAFSRWWYYNQLRIYFHGLYAGIDS